MKLNKITMMLAAAALASCSNDLNEQFTAQAPQDSRLIELDANFALAGVGAEDATTRTHWEFLSGTGLVNKFLPIYNQDTPEGQLDQVVTLEEQAVGLCWLGQNAGTDEKVYTNYQFYHFGWLNAGETAIEADNCTKDVTNGSLYNEISVNDAAGENGGEAHESAFGLPTKSSTVGLNYNSGIYKTDNKAIFGGDYIVYYPYNKEFKDAGTIPAVADVNIEGSTSFSAPALGKATFRYSKKVHINGGDQAADFGMYNLSSLVAFNIKTVTGNAISSGDVIDQIVLYSKKEQLLKQANLSAAKIVEDKKGTKLYDSYVGTKTIVANFTSGITDINTTTSVMGYITALPTTVEDLVVLVHNQTQKKWAKVSFPNKEFNPGGAATLNLTVGATDFKTDYIAVDEKSLNTALADARTAASSTNKVNIEVIGDIKLTGALAINDPKDEYITIKGDAIIVPEDVTLTVKSNMESDINVLGKSCCDGTNGGQLVVEGGLISNVTMVETEAKATTDALYDQYNPTLTYQTNAATTAAGSKVNVQAGNVVVNAIVSHKADFVVAEDAKVVVNGTGGLKFMGSTVENNGTIEVKKNGQFDMKDSNGNASASDGQRMTNNGKFIHNVDAGVGTAVQKMNQNGEYRCRVNNQVKLNDAYEVWKACSVIEMVEAGTNYNLVKACKHNGQWIDIEVNTTSDATFTNPTSSVNIGNLTVKKRLVINYVKAGDNASDLTVNGNCVSEANFVLTSIRDFKVTGDMTVNNAWVLFTASKSIDIAGNLTHNGDGLSQLNYKADNSYLKVGKDITVNKAIFNTAPKAMNVSCANFYLQNAAEAHFGNRISGTTMTVSGTISNPAGCTFDIIKANTNPSDGLIAYITCNTLLGGGTFTNSEPIVE